MREPVLVGSASTAWAPSSNSPSRSNQHDTIGQDLVNHCVNDIAVLGARPLFFLDYIGTGKLEPAVFKQILAGLAKACAAAGCALIGGETAQMPGIYQGARLRSRRAASSASWTGRTIIDGRRIRPGDAMLGLPADGLHTNGYSLARDILFNKMGLATGAARARPAQDARRGTPARPSQLPAPHGRAARRACSKGAAHITGGGLIDNLPRILPDTCDAVIDTAAWKTPRLFQIFQEGGAVPKEEMFQVFNMGVGMALVVAEKDAVRRSPRWARGRSASAVSNAARAGPGSCEFPAAPAVSKTR